MTMDILVKTQSGSNYHFIMENGSLVFYRGMHEGVVCKLYEPLKVGSRICMDCRMLNILMHEDTEISRVTSTEIVEIMISVKE